MRVLLRIDDVPTIDQGNLRSLEADRDYFPPGCMEDSMARLGSRGVIDLATVSARLGSQFRSGVFSEERPAILHDLVEKSLPVSLEGTIARVERRLTVARLRGWSRP